MFQEKEYLEKKLYKPEKQNLLEKKVCMTKEQSLQILNLYPNSVGIIRASDNTFIDINQQFLEIIGYDRTEVIGKTPQDLNLWVNPEERKYFLEMLKQGEVRNMGAYLNTKYNKIIYILLSAKTFIMDDELCNIAFILDITERKKIEEELKSSEEKFSIAFNLCPDAIAISKIDNTYLEVNESFLKNNGFQREQVIGKKLDDIGVSVDPLYYEPYMDELMKTGVAMDREIQFEFRNTKVINLVSSRLIQINGKTRKMTVLRDITKIKQAEEQLRQSEKHSREVLTNLPIAISYATLEGKILFTNNRFTELFGYTCDEITNLDTMVKMIYPEIEAKFGKKYYDEYLNILNSQNQEIPNRCFQFTSKVACKDGTEKEIETVTFNNGKYIYAAFTDITEQKEIEERLKQLSLYDALTGVYNRAFFEDHIKSAKDIGQKPVGLIVCDVDGLKVINDSLGHAAGDYMLKEVANILKSLFNNGELIARIGGDEFVVFLYETSEKELSAACNLVRERIRQYNDENPSPPISLSMGYSLSKQVPVDIYTLFIEADNYLLREKLHRKNSAKNAIVQALLKALEARDFLTEGHGDRLQNLMESFTNTIEVPECEIADFKLFAHFHDIGKVGIPDSLLFKPSKLTDDEWAVMRQHCEIGHRIAMSAPDLAPIADWILKHHEWWNGGGYPLGLKGEEIPLACRILSILDAYDAMTSDRPYRKGLSHEIATSELMRCAGTQFDPALVNAFVSMIN